MPENDHANAGDSAELLSAIMQAENLRRAWKAVKANHGGAGVDGKSIAETAVHLRQHWAAVAARLRAGSYRSAPVKAVIIPKANGGERVLGIPCVQDRLIQQALLQMLTDVFDAGMSAHSYGFRKGRSAHQAVAAASQYCRDGKHWVVDIDLKNFFDQVNHDKLMYLIAQRVRDKTVLKLLGMFLRTPMQQANGHIEPRPRGTPQGGPLSPLLANILLDPLDKELERRGLSFVRYADDVAIYVRSERAGQRILASITTWLRKQLLLEVNADKSGVTPVHQSALLGFRLSAEGEVELAPKTLARLKTRVKLLWDAKRSCTSQQLRQQWREYMAGWWNYFKFCTRRDPIKALGGWIRRHMRKCFWLRWHNPKGRRNALRRLGVSGRSLGVAVCRRGAWPMARNVVVQQALKTQVLNRYGFSMPWGN